MAFSDPRNPCSCIVCTCNGRLPSTWQECGGRDHLTSPGSGEERLLVLLRGGRSYYPRIHQHGPLSQIATSARCRMAASSPALSGVKGPATLLHKIIMLMALSNNVYGWAYHHEADFTGALC